MANLARGKDVIVPNQDTNEEGSTSTHDVSNSHKIGPNIDQKLQNWSMPKIKTNKVYKTSIFEFHPEHVIANVEKDVRIQGSCKNLVIMDSNIIHQHQRLYFGYMHLGLIQVAVKPLTRLRSEFPILICLRDIRFKRFHDSILAVLESNLQNGPAYFNYFPNYTISMKDGWAKKFLALNINVAGDKFIEGTLPISIMYRFCFKFTNSCLGTKALRESPSNETEVIEAGAQKSSKVTKRRLKHDQVTFPEEWLQDSPPSPPPQPMTFQDLANILQRAGRSAS